VVTVMFLYHKEVSKSMKSKSSNCWRRRIWYI